MNRGLTIAAGIAGALGVALAAAGAHVPDGGRLGTAGSMAMAQAPALLALGLFLPGGNLLLKISSWVIAAGLFLFAGELALHTLAGIAALGMLAPVGGSAMIFGWIGIAVAAAILRKP